MNMTSFKKKKNFPKFLVQIPQVNKRELGVACLGSGIIEDSKGIFPGKDSKGDNGGTE